MNLGELQTKLGTTLKVKTKRYPLEDRTEHINQAIRDLDDAFDSDWAEETASWATVSGTGEYLIDTYFTSPNYEFVSPIDVYYTDSDGVETTISQLTYEELRSKYPADTDDGAPLDFAIFEGKIYLRPAPDAAYTLYWSYRGRRRPLSLSSDSNDWTENEPYAVLFGALRYGTIHILEEQRFSLFEDRFQNKINSISIRQSGRMSGRRPVSQEPG